MSQLYKGVPGGGTIGNVTGPAGSTDNAVARFDGTTGKTIQNSGTTISDANVLTTGELNLTTALGAQYGGTGRLTLTDGAIIVGNGTAAVTQVGPLTDGQLLIGDTAGVDPVSGSLTAPSAGITITGGAGSITFALADDLSSVEALASTGLAARTAADTWTTRTIQQPAAGITVANGDGVAGDPTLALANDLAAIEGLASTGMAARTAADTWAVRTLTAGSTKISISNGDGVAGNPTIDATEANFTLDNIGGTLSVSKGGTGATTLTGVLTGNGTGAVTASTITQYGTLVAGASNAVSSVAPSATSGVPYISQGAASNPAFGTAVVAGGGTGRTSHTAYAVLCGGTTTTAAQQSIASVGTSGQVLTSNGAGALPTFQDASSGGAWVFLNAQTASASSSISWDNTYFDGSYDHYVVVMRNVQSANDTVTFQMTISNDNGSSYHSSGYDSDVYFGAGGGYSVESQTAYMQLTQRTATSNATDEDISIIMNIYSPTDSGVFTCMRFDHCYTAWNSAWTSGQGAAVYTTAEANNAIKFDMSSGNIASGEFILYGVSEA